MTTAEHLMARTAAPEDGARRTHRGVSFLTLTVVELRKLVDTQSGRWLLIALAAAVAGSTALMLFTGGVVGGRTFAAFLGFAQLPVRMLLPVLGILAMTGEWTQRTALTTFTLVPARGRVIAAKLAAAVLIALTATTLTATTSALANLVAIERGEDGSWAMPAGTLAGYVLVSVAFVLMGSAFGALLLNSPLAIVLNFVLPNVWTMVNGMFPGMRDAVVWLDLNGAAGPLIMQAGGTGEQWAHFGVSALVWIGLPLTAGVVRILRREVN